MSLNLKKIIKKNALAEKLLSGLYESVSAAILLFQEKKLIFMNSEASRLSSFSYEEIENKILNYEIVHPEFREEVKEIVKGFDQSELDKFDMDLKDCYKKQKYTLDPLFSKVYGFIR